MTETAGLTTSVKVLKGVGPRLAQLLAKKGIENFEDALYFLPREYEDRRKITPINQLTANQPATLLVKVVQAKLTRLGRNNRFEATVEDKSGRLKLFWFHAYPSLAEEFEVGAFFLVYGQVDFYGIRAQMVHPEYERVKEFIDGRPAASFHFGRIVPVYSESEGLAQKTLRKIMAQAIQSSLPALGEPLPEDLRTRLKLPSLRESFVAIHYPKEVPEPGALSSAVRRIIFEEFFVLQLGLGLKKRKWKREVAPPMKAGLAALETFVAALPFALTGDQKKVLEEIKTDISSNRAMTRLLQGDVGAGKTVVALAAAAQAAGAGYQTALMAPTEILAQQHFRTAEKLGLRTELVVSANSAKKEVRARVASGEAEVIVGTHALFQGGVEFKRLGLVVVDEQHRFGVEQRNDLLRKADGLVPHLLMMTATPIPRTLALTLYGDLDLSLVREKPAGRQPVKTEILRDRERPRLYQRIREAVGRGEQVYIIYPLVENSEKLELKSATEQYDKLRREVFPELSIALLHGRMKPEEKEQVLLDFKNKKYSILVSTTVIEVGIDVANATLMVIEHPERLGLSQLHQLRGRVGRGSAASSCLLVAAQQVSERLRVMEKTEDGFVIAEEDLKIRGPGEFLGKRQSGLPGFRVGHILRDAALLSLARDEAQKVLEHDPELTAPEHAEIRRMVESRWREKIERLMGG